LREAATIDGGFPYSYVDPKTGEWHVAFLDECRRLSDALKARARSRRSR
jgi:hypothetical protein